MISKSPNEDGVKMNTYTREPKGWAAKEAWTRHQALIRQLYEKKPLKEVMRHMADQHGFRATTKMYKTHIQQWGLDKKIKDVEMRAVVRKHKQRADQGKSSIIHVRGQSRRLEEFIRHCGRKSLSIDDIIARHTLSPTPDTVELLTPVPSRISTPQVLEVPEHMFRRIREYFSGSFESGTWISTEPLTYCYSIKCVEGEGTLANEFYYQCVSACELFSKGLFEEGGRTMNAAFARIKRVIQTDQPETVYELFSLISYLRLDEKQDIGLTILRYFSDLSKVLLGKEHPLTRIFGWYDLLYTPDFEEVASRCVEGMTDHFESFIGAMHLSTLLLRAKSVDFVAQNGDTRIQRLRRLLDECEGKLQPYDLRSFVARHSLAVVYYIHGYYIEARSLSQESIANSQYLGSHDRTDYETHCLYVIARCQYALGGMDLGIANLNEAINSRISMWGPQETMARAWLVDLEDLQLEQGNWDQAAQIRDYILKTLPPIEE